MGGRWRGSAAMASSAAGIAPPATKAFGLDLAETDGRPSSVMAASTAASGNGGGAVPARAIRRLQFLRGRGILARGLWAEPAAFRIRFTRCARRLQRFFCFGSSPGAARRLPGVCSSSARRTAAREEAVQRLGRASCTFTSRPVGRWRSCTHEKSCDLLSARPTSRINDSSNRPRSRHKYAIRRNNSASFWGVTPILGMGGFLPASCGGIVARAIAFKLELGI